MYFVVIYIIMLVEETYDHWMFNIGDQIGYNHYKSIIVGRKDKISVNNSGITSIGMYFVAIYIIMLAEETYEHCMLIHCLKKVKFLAKMLQKTLYFRSEKLI